MRTALKARAVNTGALDTSTNSNSNSKLPQPQPTWDGFKKALGISAGTAVGAAAVAMYINGFSSTSCIVTGDCNQISDVMKALLIGTHLFTFVLVPGTMYVFYDKIEQLYADRARSPFVVLLGLSLIMVAVMSEIGWHIEQDWYYKEEYNILNMGFYFFLCSGLSAWAFGLRLNAGSDAVTPSTAFLEAPQPPATSSTPAAQPASGFNLGNAADTFLLAVPALTVALYGLAAAQIHTKVPIYIEMSAIFVALTYRFWQLLRTPKVLLFPFFSVGVNLFFISLLDKHQHDAFLNPLFHMLHDAAGTELGILIIAVLTYTSPLLADAAAPQTSDIKTE
ncbi:hypothetical protein OEZ86_006363 [Tetradesmus obliquus]|nr:hypothetical protein OEZ86_006363 [Tetradesmus obliquus]